MTTKLEFDYSLRPKEIAVRYNGLMYTNPSDANSVIPSWTQQYAIAGAPINGTMLIKYIDMQIIVRAEDPLSDGMLDCFLGLYDDPDNTVELVDIPVDYDNFYAPDAPPVGVNGTISWESLTNNESAIIWERFLFTNGTTNEVYRIKVNKKIHYNGNLILAVRNLNTNSGISLKHGAGGTTNDLMEDPFAVYQRTGIADPTPVQELYSHDEIYWKMRIVYEVI